MLEGEREFVGHQAEACLNFDTPTFLTLISGSSNYKVGVKLKSEPQRFRYMLKSVAASKTVLSI